MRRAIPFLLCLAALTAFHSCSLGPDRGTQDDWLLQLSLRVSHERLMSSVYKLSSIHSRFMHWDPGTAATIEWLDETLAAQGTPAMRDSFTFWRTRWIETANIEVLFPGEDHPEREVLVGAHWDSIDYPESFQDSSVRAPGADDNASGVAALIELARLLRDVPCENSIRLIFFAGEEIGLKGSYHARERWSDPQNSDSLICLVNVDMVGHDDHYPDSSLLCTELEVSLAVAALETVRRTAFSGDLDIKLASIGHPHGSSDHLPFWYNGLPAIWLHEGPKDALLEANTEADIPAVVDPAYLADCTRALLGIVLHLAVPVIEDPQPRLP